MAFMYAHAGCTQTTQTMHVTPATHAAHADEISGDMLERGLPVGLSASPLLYNGESVLLEQVCP